MDYFSEAEDQGDGKWRVRFIAEGTSKNGVHYGHDVLARDFATAVPSGTRMLANHDQTGPSTGGDINRIAGKTISEAEVIPGDGAWGVVQIDRKWRSFVENYKDQIGLSIHVAGDWEDKGSFREATEMRADPYNSVDLVLAPSAGGKFDTRFIESYEQISGSKYLTEHGAAPVVSDSTQERESMDEKEFRTLLESVMTPLVERLGALETELADVRTFSESVKAALPEPATAVDRGAAFEAGAKAANAGLSESAIKRVSEAFVASGDATASLDSEIAIRKEYLSEGFIPGALSSQTSGSETVTISAWAAPKAGK
jgi:hypothetical protein